MISTELSLWVTAPELAVILGISYRQLRRRMRVWSKTEAEVRLPDKSTIRLYRTGHCWYAKRADLTPSKTESKPKGRTHELDH